MKSATLLLFTLGALAPFAGQAAGSSSVSLAGCATALKDFHPELSGPKQVVKRRSGPKGRYEYWINAGTVDGQPEARIYCQASRREGVIAMAVGDGNWAQGEYPRPEGATAPSDRVRIASQPDQ